MSREIHKFMLLLAAVFLTSFSALLVIVEAGNFNKNSGSQFYINIANEQFVQTTAVIFLIAIWFVYSLTLGFGKSFGVELNSKGLSKVASYLIILTLIVVYQVFIAKYMTYVFAATPTPTPPTLTDSPDPQKGGSAVTFQFTCDDGANNVEGYVCKDATCTNCLYGTTTNCWCASGSVASNPSCTYSCPAGSTSTNTYYGKCRSSAGQYTAATAAATFKCDGVAPRYSLNSTSSNLAGVPVTHFLNWTDDTSLSGYVFSFDNCKGTFTNSTWSAFSGTWSNVTMNVNTTVGCTVRWCIYANDSLNNWNGTSCSNPFSYTAKGVPVLTLNNGTFSVNTSGLVGYWRFENETLGYSTDYSGYGNTGTQVSMNNNSVSGPTTSGRFGNAMQFDGANDYVDAGNSASLHPTSSMTVSVWFNTNAIPTGGGNADGILGTGDSAVTNAYWMWIDWTAVGFWMRNSTTNVGATTADISTNRWYHAVGTYNGTHVNFYLNGTLRQSTLGPQNFGTNTNKLLIGLANIWYFNGTIDEVQIYNRSLTADEIKELYESRAIRPAQTNFTCTANTAQVDPQLYRNNTGPIAGDSDAQALGVGYYYYICNASATTNYTRSAILLPLNVVDTTPPLWQNPGTNDTDNIISQGEAINLTAQGKDDVALNWAWLSTNETGSWSNNTMSNAGSNSTGFTSIGSTSYSTSSYASADNHDSYLIAGYLRAQKFTTGSNPITVTQIGPHLDGATGTMVMGLYNDSSGYPGSLLAQTNEFTPSTGWPLYNLATPVYLSSNTQYWIVGLWSDTGTTLKWNSLTAASGTSYRCSYGYTSTLPSSFPCSDDPRAAYNLFQYVYSQIKGYMKATKTTLSENGTVTQLNLYSHSTAGNARVALYSDSGGAPATLQVESGSQALSAGWNTFDVTDISLSAGTYWLVWQYDGAASAPSYTAGSAGDGYYKIQEYGAFPSSFGSGTSSSEKWSMYMNYTLYNYSRMYMLQNNQWQWSNFTWSNSSVAGGTTVGWRIYYNDTSGNNNGTDIMTFTIRETTPPRWFTNTTSIAATYSPTTASQLNITWTDNVAVSATFIEGNWSGSAVNYTPSVDGDVRYLSTILPAGTHYWKSYANDTSNNWNTSSQWVFTVAKAKPTLVLSNNTASVNTSGLVGYWRFEEGSGTTASDSSGNGKTGTFTNSPSWNSSGKFGYGVTTSGNAYISVPTVDIGNEWSIESWFLSPIPSPVGGWATLTRGSNDHQILAYEGRDLGTYDNAGGSGFHDCGWDINSLSSGWHHIVAIGNTTGYTNFYVDGTWKCASNFRSTLDVVSIGNYQGGGQPWGTFDEVQIFNRSLTADEIRELYESRVQYPTQTTFTASEPNTGDTDVTYSLYRNISLVTSTENGTAVRLPAGYHYYVFNATAGTNYTTASLLLPLNITKGVVYPDTFVNGTAVWSYVYPTATNVTCNVSHVDSAASGPSCSLYRDEVSKGTGEVTRLPTGSYVYKTNTSGNANYSANVSGQTRTLSITIAGAPTVAVTFDRTTGRNYTSGINLGIQCDITNGENSILQIYRNTTLVKQTTTNATQTTYNDSIGVGVWNYSCYFLTSRNYTAASSIDNNFVVYKAVPVLTMNNNTASVNTSGLVGYWRFENESLGTAMDYSGWGNNGTLTNMNNSGNATSGPTTNGRFGNAMRLDGVNDYVTVQDSNNWYFGTGDFTIDFWVMLNTFPSSDDYQVVWTQYADEDNRALLLLYGPSSSPYWQFAVFNGGSPVFNFIYYVPPMSTNTWYHVVLARTGSSFKVFQNGALIDTGTSSNEYPNIAGNFLIGQRGSSQKYLNGSLDEFQIWKNRSLTADEIKELYESRVQYPTQTMFNATESNSGDADVTYGLYRNTTLVTSTENGTAMRLPAGYHYYVFNATAGANYTTASLLLPVNVTQGSLYPDTFVNSTATWSYQYPTATNVTCNITQVDGGSGPSCSLWRDDVSKGTSEVTKLPVGSYVYRANATGTANYTANTTGQTRTLTITSGAAPTVTVTFDRTSGRNYTSGNNLGIQCDVTSEASILQILRNNTVVKQTVTNATQVTYNDSIGVGTWNYSCYYIASRNYSAASSINNNFVVYKAVPVLTLNNNTASVNTSGLVGYWRFEETNSSATDYSGYDNAGTYKNGATTAVGRFGNAASFDGVDDNVEVGDSNSLDATNAITVAGWIYIPQTAGNVNSYFLVKDYAYHIIVGWNEYSRPYFTIDGTERTTDNQYEIAAGGWHFVAATYDSSTRNISFWIDNELKEVKNLSGLAVYTINASAEALYPSWSTTGRQQTIDEVQIWNRSLTADEIKELYESRVQYPTSTNFTGSNCPTGQLDVTCNLYRNTTLVSSSGNLGNTVGTSTGSEATSYAFMRKTCFQNGRFWVFYGDGSDMGWRTSTDENSWSSFTAVPGRGTGGGWSFAIYCDGTYVHYAFGNGNTNQALFYRRGTTLANGSITWSDVEQNAVPAVASTGYYEIGIAVDSSGRPWIGYVMNNATSYYIYATASSLSNGTWSTATGFPYYLAIGATSATAIPLTNNKMGIVYGDGDSAKLAIRTWTGSAWNAAVEPTSLYQSGHTDYFSAVAQGDDIHLVWLNRTSNYVVYVKYTYATNSLSAETTLQTNPSSTSAPVISIDATANNTYVFWSNNSHIYYKKYTAATSTWDTNPTDWITEAALTGNDRLTSFYQASNGMIGVEYMNGTASPYQVRFAILNPNSVSDAQTLGAGYNYYLFNTSGGANYTQSGILLPLNITKGVVYPNAFVNSTATWSYAYPTATNVTCNVSSQNNEASCTLSRDEVIKGTSETTTLPAGSYVYRANASQTTNYTANATGQTRTLTITSGAAPTVTVTFDRTSPQVYTTGINLGIQCDVTNGENSILQIYRNGTMIKQTSSNATQLTHNESLGAGVWNYSCYYLASRNYTAAYSINNNFVMSGGTPSMFVAPLASVTYPTATQTGCQLITGDAGATLTLYRNGTQAATGTTATINETAITLGAAVYNYTCVYTASANYSAGSSANNYLTVNQNSTNPVNLYFNSTANANKTYTYPQFVNATGEAVYSNSGTVNLYRNTGAAIADAQEIILLGNGTYSYKVNITGNANYTSNATGLTYYVHVNKGTVQPSLSATPGWTNTYPTQTVVSCAVTSQNNEVSCSLARDEVIKGTSETTTLPVGSYLYRANSSVTANYSANTTGETRTMAITIGAAPTVTITFDRTSPQNYASGNNLGIQCDITNGENTVLQIWRNTTMVKQTTSNATQVTYNDSIGVGVWNYSCYYIASQNYSATSSINNNFVVNRAAQATTLQLNGTSADRNYVIGQVAEIKAFSNISSMATTIWANFTGPLLNITPSATGTVTNYTNTANLAIGSYLVRANTTGNENYTSSTSDSYTLAVTQIQVTPSCEAGGPYTTTSNIIVIGNVTDTTGTTLASTVTVDIMKSGVLQMTSSTTSGSDGGFYAEFAPLTAGSYIANVTANYDGSLGYCNDTFNVAAAVACVEKTIGLSGYAFDYSTGQIISSGTVRVEIKETGDVKEASFSGGYWSLSFTSCFTSGTRYTAAVKITDSSTGKVSYTQLEFVAK